MCLMIPRIVQICPIGISGTQNSLLIYNAPLRGSVNAIIHYQTLCIGHRPTKNYPPRRMGIVCNLLDVLFHNFSTIQVSFIRDLQQDSRDSENRLLPRRTRAPQSRMNSRSIATLPQLSMNHHAAWSRLRAGGCIRSQGSRNRIHQLDGRKRSDCSRRTLFDYRSNPELAAIRARGTLWIVPSGNGLLSL